MLPIAIFFLILFAAAMLFAWLMDNPGTVTIDWLGTEITLSMVQSIVAFAILLVMAMVVWAIIAAIIRGPKTFDRFRKGRRRDKGYDALSRGLIAAGAGNAPLARQLTKESGKYLEDEPLVAMLDAQTSLIENDRMAAREKFAAMMDRDETRLLGLRGLYLEAEREGASEASAQYARAAADEAPGTPWAARAALKARVLAGEWEEALAALQSARSSGAIDKDTYNRQRAVLLTARAIDVETPDPSSAKTDALRAHKLAPELVPAALVAARTCIRLGDMRKATAILERTWRESPHPDIAETYMNVRAGDSASDRLKRAETLNAKRGGTVEGSYALARGAMDVGDYGRAREAMQIVLTTAPTERACLLMADIEEAEHGDTGRVREWLSRAVTAPRDPVWTDGTYVSKNWAPISPATGEIDAFQWRVPMESIGGAAQAIDYESLSTAPKMTPDHEEIVPVESQVAAARMNADVVDAEIIEKPATPKAPPANPAPTGSEQKPVAAAIAPTIEKQANDKPDSDRTDNDKPDSKKKETDKTGIDKTENKPTEKPVPPSLTSPSPVVNTAGFTAPGATASPTSSVKPPHIETSEQKKSGPVTQEPDDTATSSAKSGVVEKPVEPTPASKPKPAIPTANTRATYPRTSEEARRNLDADKDGRLDRSPDDPGVDGGEKSKGLLNRMGLK